MGTSSGVAGLFEPEDGVARVWDEAEAVLRACEDLGAVMETIRSAVSPVEARRALKSEFGFTGRQAAVLLTLPVMTFTRSERQRLDAGRRARMDLFADVTGVLPAVRDDAPESPPRAMQPALPSPLAAGSDRSTTVRTTTTRTPAATVSPGRATPDELAPMAPERDWDADFDGILEGIRTVMDEYGRPAAEQGPVAQTQAQTPTPPPTSRPTRRSVSDAGSGPVDAQAVLDEQIGELCDAIAGILDVEPRVGARFDDPRESTSPSGTILDNCGVTDSTGLRTYLWHLHRTGLDSVEGLLPFAEPLTVMQGFDVQTERFERAMATGGLGARPGGDVTWAGRLWPLAQRHGYGYALSYREGPDSGAIWAYGGDEPLHRLWDSVVDLLIDLYQAFTAGTPCDAALAAVARDRVAWTNLG